MKAQDLKKSVVRYKGLTTKRVIEIKPTCNICAYRKVHSAKEGQSLGLSECCKSGAILKNLNTTCGLFRLDNIFSGEGFKISAE